MMGRGDQASFTDLYPWAVDRSDPSPAGKVATFPAIPVPCKHATGIFQFN